MVGDEGAGIEKHGGNLTFVVVFKAGHLVPMDQIDNSVNLMERWINGTGW